MDENLAQYCRTKSTPKTCTFTWIIENFSMLSQRPGEALCSTTFSLDKSVTFQLLLYPKGLQDDRMFASYMYIHLKPKLEGLQSIKLNCWVSILNKRNKLMRQRKFEDIYFNEGDFLSRPECFIAFADASKCLFGNCLKIFCSITAAVDVSTIEDVAEVVKEICVDIPPYHSQLYEEKEFADFTFLLDNQKLKAHKCILAASSTVFKSMLQHGNWKENVKDMMEITDVSLEVFEEMLHYIYLGTVKNLHKIAPELIYLAEKYDLQGLKALCAEKLSEEIGLENAWTVLKIANDCIVGDLKKDAMEFILSNRALMIISDEYVSIASKNPNLIAEIFSLK